jgi:hypothetical protein
VYIKIGEKINIKLATELYIYNLPICVISSFFILKKNIEGFQTNKPIEDKNKNVAA